MDKVRRALNEEYREALKADLLIRFDVEITTEYDFGNDVIVSRRTDGRPFTPEQAEHIKAFEAGYLAAWHTSFIYGERLVKSQPIEWGEWMESHYANPAPMPES